jgi:hypothetical protein
LGEGLPQRHGSWQGRPPLQRRRRQGKLCQDEDEGPYKHQQAKAKPSAAAVARGWTTPLASFLCGLNEQRRVRSCMVGRVATWFGCIYPPPPVPLTDSVPSSCIPAQQSEDPFPFPCVDSTVELLRQLEGIGALSMTVSSLVAQAGVSTVPLGPRARDMRIA